MTRTYAKRPRIQQTFMWLSCSQCKASIRSKVPVDPEGWPQHRCHDLVVRRFDIGEQTEAVR